MKRQQQEKEIQLVLNYSRKIYGSCNHSYMGCLADTHLRGILGDSPYWPDMKPYDVLLAEADDKTIAKGHEYIDHWVPIAKAYMKPSARISRAVAQFK